MKKKIGSWVNLERKDIINEIQKIENKEGKIKTKQKEKFSNLIEINK